MDEYKTIKKESTAQFIEKRSKFICYACPISVETQANEYIKKISSKHWDAKHNVYAYRLREQQIDRYSDDGEPQGTAGIQVLNMLKNLDIIDLVVVITRYFGGILLGTGGLIRAYSYGAKLAVESSNVVLMKKCKMAEVSVDYEIYGKVQNVLKKFNAAIQDVKFFETVSIVFNIEMENYENLQKTLKEISSGKIFIEVLEEKYFYFK